MGEVYEAVDRRLGRTVAVKLLRPELADDERFLVRFRREASTAARLATRASWRCTTSVSTATARSS